MERTQTQKRLFVLAVGAALAVVAGVALAAIPRADGVIEACYQKKTGKLRVVDRASACRKSEIPLAWNQEGEKGDPGPAGPPGPVGPPGPAGGALGYAYVRQDGFLFSSKGILQVTHPATGVWCFDLDFTPHVAVATVTGFAGLGNQIIHTSIDPGARNGCPGSNPADAAAFMVLPDGTRTDYQFFIEFN